MGYYKFNRLKMYGFMSYENAEIGLDSNGYVLISGINNDARDNAKSNGSGKSSLISDSILWVLTGETSRGAKQVANNVLNNGVMVELEFYEDNTKYKIIRSRNHKELGTNLKIYINDEDKSGKGIRDGEELLKKYLPDLTPLLISSVMILGQGMPNKFTNNTPSGRKELLEKLSKSDFMIEDIKNKLSARKNELSESIRKLEDNILATNTKLTIKEEEIKKHKEELEKCQQVDAFNPEEIKQKIKDKEEKLKKIDEEIENLEKQLTEERERFLKLDSELKDYIIQKHEEENQKINPLSIEQVEINANIRNLTKEIEEHKNIKDVCPTCGQKIVGVHKIDTTEKEKELELLKENKNKLEESIKKEKETIEKEIEEYKQENTKQKDEIQKQGNLLKENLNNKKEEKKYLTNELNSDTIKLQELEGVKQLIEIRKENIKVLESDIVGLRSEKEKLNEDKSSEEKHLEIISKMTTFATRDFRGILLSNIIEFINKKIKEYSQTVSNHDNVSFALNGNNIEIQYNNKEYELLSGGEKQKLDLIIQFAIRDMLNKYLNFNTNILVLDEVMDFLDETGCKNIINLIENYCRDIDSVYFITHHTELNFPYDKEIQIMKDAKGISRVVAG